MELSYLTTSFEAVWAVCRLLIDFPFLDALGFFLGRGRELAFQVGFDDETCHWGRQVGTEATVLHIDGNGNLGIVHRRKGDKG